MARIYHSLKCEVGIKWNSGTGFTPVTHPLETTNNRRFEKGSNEKRIYLGNINFSHPGFTHPGFLRHYKYVYNYDNYHNNDKSCSFHNHNNKRYGNLNSSNDKNNYCVHRKMVRQPGDSDLRRCSGRAYAPEHHAVGPLHQHKRTSGICALPVTAVE